MSCIKLRAGITSLPGSGLVSSKGNKPHLTEINFIHGSKLPQLLKFRISDNISTRFESSQTRAALQEVSADSTTNASLVNLISWLTTNGALKADSPTKPAAVSEGLGLLAARNISSGEDLFSVPQPLCIGREVVAESSMGEFTKDLRAWLALALFLIREKENPSSKWSAYFSTLPLTLDLPIFWSEEDLAEIQGSQLLSSVENLRDYLMAEYNQLKETLFDPNPADFPSDLFTLDAFMWAFGILRSRTFPPLTGEAIALVPLADMVNHGPRGSAPDKVGWELRSAGLFDRTLVVAMKAGRKYEAGEQIVMEYGKGKSNAELALDFGFAEWEEGVGLDLGTQSRDVFTLTLEVAAGDRFFDDKADVLECNGLESTMSFDVAKGEGPPETMLGYLRLVALSGADAFLLESIFRGTVWGHCLLPVSQENEEAICQAMIGGCRATLEGYSTTIEQDIRFLKKGGLNQRLKTAIIVRLGEKQVLTELLDWFEARLQRLDQLMYYAERRLQDLGLLDDQGSMTAWERF